MLFLINYMYVNHNMKNIYSYVFERCSKKSINERLILNNQSKLREKIDYKEADKLSDYIINVFNIAKTFFRYKELKNALNKYIIDNDITKDKLGTPYVCGKDQKEYKARNQQYRRGRVLHVEKCMENANVIIGDPQNDYIVFYFSKKCLLLHTTDLNNIEMNIFFLIN